MTRCTRTVETDYIFELMKNAGYNGPVHLGEPVPSKLARNGVRPFASLLAHQTRMTMRFCQIVDIKCRGDVEITWHQFDAVQHCRRGASHHVVDAGFVKNTEQRGHVGWFALRLTFGRAGHL